MQSSVDAQEMALSCDTPGGTARSLHCEPPSVVAMMMAPGVPDESDQPTAKQTSFAGHESLIRS